MSESSPATRFRPGAPVGGDQARSQRLLAHVERAWPRRARPREVAGLPGWVADVLRPGRRRGALERAAAELDGALPGWVELGAAMVAGSALGEPSPEVQRASAMLARRPLRRPEILLSLLPAARGEGLFWVLVALAGTDTAAVREAWLRALRLSAGREDAGEDRALWFAFARAALGDWISWEDFRGCLVGGRALIGCARNGDYRAGLDRIGLSNHPGFAKRYRQLIYEIAHDPEARLSWGRGGWIRDFPGEDYLWDALAELETEADAWWPLHVVRWASGIDEGGGADDLRRHPAGLLCLLSLLRPDLCASVGQVLGAPEHEAAIRWLRETGPAERLDLDLMADTIAPWAEVAGEGVTLAAGALCSLTPPADFVGAGDPVLRRRAFVRQHLLPSFDRVMDNLCYVHALRGRHLELICEQAKRGLPAALRALALWPETPEEAAPLIFRVQREGGRLARQAAGEALLVLRRKVGVADLRRLERRVDLASAWADAGLEGKPARVWWDVAGYRMRLAVAGGKVRVEAYTGRRRLAGVPVKVQSDERYLEIREARRKLAKSYRYFRRRFEEMMVEAGDYPGADFAVLLANPVVRSLASRLVLSVDGRPLLWTPEDPMGDSEIVPEVAGARRVTIAHPVELSDQGTLEEWQLRAIECRLSQPFKQVFREVYVPAEAEKGAEYTGRFGGHPLVARRAFALLRSRGYSPRGGDAVREWPGAGVRVHIEWARPREQAGKQLGEADGGEPVTSGRVWFEDGMGRRLALEELPPIIFSEALRDADLLISRASAGELGFSSEETRRLRATLVRYLARALGLTTVYVGEDSTHVIVEGRRAAYRVHLGSGSVLLEKTRRGLDLGDVGRRAEAALQAESMDSVTARIIAIISALSQDDRITDADFLRQLPPLSSTGSVL